MDRGFLQNLDAKNIEREQRIISEKIMQGTLFSEICYPDPDQVRIIEPHTTSIGFTNIYNQLLPHIGTLLVELRPVNIRSEFERVNGFQIEDIDRLIDYAKKTRKNQNLRFILRERATAFYGMDYLEPLFREFNPPSGIHVSIAALAEAMEHPYVHRWLKDGILLADASIPNSPVCKSFLRDMFGPTFEGTKYWETVIARTYTSLRLLGYDKLADEIAIDLSVDPLKAVWLIGCAKDIILFPNESVLRGLFSFDRNAFGIAKNLIFPYVDSTKVFEGERFSFPAEVGLFLNNKLKVVIPKNVNGVLEVSDRYSPLDMASLVNALNQAVSKLETEKVAANTQQINSAFETAWNDALSLHKSANIAKHGISFGLATIGAIATMPIGGVGGLLAGLGFEVFERALEKKTLSSVSKRLVGYSKPNHLLQIYDFQEKYRLDS
jgi:hypothetical protein